MSAEQRWADRKEWEQERGEIEIKSRWVISSEWNTPCNVAKCDGVATVGREVGLVSSHGGAKFEFCADHGDDDFAFKFYERMRRA